MASPGGAGTDTPEAPAGYAISTPSFYENRAGRGLSTSRKRSLAAAKRELRRLYKRPPR